MSRVYNFCAGPAALPEPVLKQAQVELLDWQGRGTSIMEISHRSADFEAVAAEAEANLRDLLQIPSNYKVLFLSGGSRIQFSMLPLNLLGDKTQADYIATGIWSNYAIEEAQKYCQVNIVADGKISDYTEIPSPEQWQFNKDAAYFHYTSNETIDGIQFKNIPQVGEVPLVADMSSDILAEPIDVSRFGMIYASAQKNIGPSGLSIVIVREDLLNRASPLTPSVHHYAKQAANNSFVNTPPTFSWYLSGLVFKWLKQQGGLAAIAAINHRKAEKLYHAIDNSRLYHNKISKSYRSTMNVTFFLKQPELTVQFVQEAAAAGLVNLKGHSLVGGIRASIYNAVPEAAVDSLISFMKDFEYSYCK